MHVISAQTFQRCKVVQKYQNCHKLSTKIEINNSHKSSAVCPKSNPINRVNNLFPKIFIPLTKKKKKKEPK